MTDRVHSLTIVLNEDRRIDDVQPLIAAIYQMRNVAHVDVNITDYTTLMAESRAKLEARKLLFEVLDKLK